MGQRWGQHFLHDRSVVERMLGAARVGPDCSVFEIGPGPGILTEPLCERAGRVVAFEIDPVLADNLPAHPNLEVVRGDFLKADLRGYLADSRWKVIANLPYYITAPILEKLLLEASPRLDGLWLMMQKEVALRITSPASREAGSLTYFVHYFTLPELLFKVKPGAFRPPPEVDSAVVAFHPRQSAPECDRGKLFQLIRRAFSMRRKTLGRSLRGLVEEPNRVLEKAGIDARRRPETLQLEEFIQLERAWNVERS